MKKILLLSAVLFSLIQVQAQRIIGGNYVTPGAYPWIVSLEVQGDAICGAALIAPNWVLTAGHCGVGFPPYIPQPDKVVVDLYSRNSPNGSAEVLIIDTIYVHPDFNTSTFDGPDIALIKLTTASSKQPVSLPAINDHHLYNTNRSARVLGWGSINSMGDQSDTLREAGVYIIDFDTCKSNYANASYPWILEDYYVCAGYLKDSAATGAGAGDSGGPLVTWNNNEWVHIGIVSGGDGMITTEQHPGVFTRTIEFREWIDSIITANTYAGIADVQEAGIELLVKGDHLEVRAKSTTGGSMDVIVYNTIGQEVIATTGRNENEIVRIGLNDLASGIYIASVRTKNGMLSRKFYKM